MAETRRMETPIHDDASVCVVRAELQPELWVDDTAAAVAYYVRAFGAVVEHRVGGPDDADGVAQLSVSGARFWISGASEQLGRFNPASIGGATGRVLLVVDDPPSVTATAAAAGGELTSRVAEEHGWLLGRVVDPFGHEWEIGRPVGPWPPQA
jgi:PhnB protein